jgi:hypothetical protein
MPCKQLVESLCIVSERGEEGSLTRRKTYANEGFTELKRRDQTLGGELFRRDSGSVGGVNGAEMPKFEDHGEIRQGKCILQLGR